MDNLINVYAWSKQNDKVKLSTGQRICLTQERAAIMRVIDGLSPMHKNAQYEVDERKITYRIPEHLEQKVNLILQIIKSTNWEKPTYAIDPY